MKKKLGRPCLDADGSKVEIGTVTLTAAQAAAFDRLVSIVGSRAAAVRYLLVWYNKTLDSATRPNALRSSLKRKPR